MKATAQISIINGDKQTAQEQAELVQWLQAMVTYIATVPAKLAPRFHADYNKPKKKRGGR